ncbi:sensor domain-containing diguanylate cyclase [Domibacillus indicus]|uniref:sensor domain-containing diguanylate cyclase n=1 Tax=Domibacillus indicus TaxID=1437523 RepID=UPI002041FCEE|nr:sensor domain-containing diguanylate cyclase [Domibacillus indicus]MCM3789257.1 sensor domain-containing diguanylate cyclase [Domibacillus indicus]
MKQLFTTRKVSLATLLTSLVCASVILTVLIMVVSSYQSEKDSLTRTYLSLNYSKSSKISQSVGSLFHSMRLSLEDTAEFLQEKDTLSDEEIQEQLELLRNSSRYFNSLSWVDETGLMRNIAPLSTGLKGQVITTGETKKVLDTKKPALTAPYIGPSGRLLVSMSQPLYDKNGTYRGMIGGSIYLQEENVLNEILGNDATEENGSYYYVVGPDGTLLFHPDQGRIGEDGNANTVVRKLMQGKSGAEQVTNKAGIPMLAAYSAIPEIGWGVVQQTPVSSMKDVLQNHIEKLVLRILPPFLLLLALSILIARKLAAPFMHLADLMNRLASGKAVPVPDERPHWNREADLLTKSVAIAIRAVKENNQKLTHAAITDPLTGIPNRRELDERMESWAAQNRRFSLVIIDIDHFKQINDTYGHQMGDETLKQLVSTIQSIVRKTDICFRYGGEEFIMLLPDTTGLEAYSIAEKVRIAVENKIKAGGRPVTISLGIAEFPLQSASLAELFQLADQALYQSKSEGRNRATISYQKVEG